MIAILVPTLNRPGRLPGLVENAHAATASDHTVYLIAEVDDAETCEVASSLAGPGCRVVAGRFGGYPAAINAGYRASSEPYFLCVNDDVRFAGGWDTEALRLMAPPVRAVGINQGNGRTESFALVERSYIEEMSGVFDRPDTVLHEYRSQFCDDEFADLAKQRGVWADAHDALIEHEHWTFGKSPMDANYEKAVASYAEDLATYEERRRRWQAA